MRKKNLKTAKTLDRIMTAYLEARNISDLKVIYHSTDMVFQTNKYGRSRFSSVYDDDYVRKCSDMLGIHEYFIGNYFRGKSIINERHLYEIQYKPKFREYAEMDAESLLLLFKLNHTL